MLLFYYFAANNSGMLFFLSSVSKETKRLQMGISNGEKNSSQGSLLDTHSEFPMKDITKRKLPSIRFTVLFPAAPLEMVVVFQDN